MSIDFATRQYNHNFRMDPIVRSRMDNDFYKFLMGQVIHSLHPLTQVTFSLTNRTKDGRTIICDWYNTPLIDATGQIIGVASLVLDVTGRKRAEDALAAEKERLTVTLRSIGDGVIATDTEGRVSVINKLAEDLTKMELLVDVDEADIGHVQEGQKATFTVDAFLHDFFKDVVVEFHIIFSFYELQ
mgnify:CR=1 FL=1